MIEMYLGLYLCLLDLAVHGALTVVYDAVEEAESFLTTAFAEAAIAVNATVSVINDALADAEKVADVIPGYVELTAAQC